MNLALNFSTSSGGKTTRQLFIHSDRKRQTFHTPSIDVHFLEAGYNLSEVCLSLRLSSHGLQETNEDALRQAFRPVPFRSPGEIDLKF